MTRTGLIILAVTLLSGCGKGPVTADAQPYVESFMAAAKAHGRVIQMTASIQFGDVQNSPSTNESDVGVCNGMGVSIVLDQTYWSTASDTSKMLVVWHELGHCLLLRGHRADTTTSIQNNPIGSSCDGRDSDGNCISTALAPNGFPVSIMHPTIPVDVVVANNPEYKQALIDEMFSDQ